MFRGLLCLWLLSQAVRSWSAEDPWPVLRERLTHHVAQSKFDAAQWGIKVVDLGSGEVKFDHQPGKLVKPASNAKLFTGALALDKFGPDHRIATSLYASQKPDSHGVLTGDLIVFGRGDPSFAARFIRQGNEEGLLDGVAEAVVKAGVRRVTGDLVGDERYFRGAPFGMNWSWDDLQYSYGAEVSPLSVQDNVVDLFIKPAAMQGAVCEIETEPKFTTLDIINRTQTVAAEERRFIHVQRPLGGNKVYVSGQIPIDGRAYTTASTVHRPARWFVAILREALAKRGVVVEGEDKTVNWLERYPVDYTRMVNLGNVYSQPMAELVRLMMKQSQNLYAQLLLLQVGAVAPQASEDQVTTEERGLEALDKFLRQAGLSQREVHLEEGSGLSRGALVTPNAITGLLRYMWNHSQREAFIASLPVSGQDGTLTGRLKGETVRGHVRAKTGTLDHVSALSGYLHVEASSAGPLNTNTNTLAFSVILNQFSGSRTAAREAVDEVVLLLAENLSKSQASKESRTEGEEAKKKESNPVLGSPDDARKPGVPSVAPAEPPDPTEGVER